MKPGDGCYPDGEEDESGETSPVDVSVCSESEEKEAEECSGEDGYDTEPEYVLPCQVSLVCLGCEGCVKPVCPEPCS